MLSCGALRWVETTEVILRPAIVRDAVHGVSSVDSGLFQILGTVEFQRLRWIRQTGLVCLVYPGAEHSRFTHSLGVYNVADRLFEHLRTLSANAGTWWGPSRPTEDLKKVFQAAALCHDLGHTAFSHLFEPALLPHEVLTHEDCALAIVRENSEIAEKLKNWCDHVQLLDLLTSKHWHHALCSLVSGPHFDVDRWDYLLRDAHETGVSYGIYDLEWLIHSLQLHTSPERQPIIVLDGKRGAAALQQFLFARRYMYRQVYFHRTVHAAQQLLRATFNRGMDPTRQGYAKEEERSLVARPLRSVMFKRGRPTMGEFLETDDAALLTTVRAWAAHSEDPLLRYLSDCFVRRRLPKLIDLGPSIEAGAAVVDSKVVERIRHAVRGSLSRNPQLSSTVNDDNALDYLVLQHAEEFEGSDIGTMPVYWNGKIRPLSNLREDVPEFHLLDEFVGSFKLFRLFVPEDTLGAVREELDERG